MKISTQLLNDLNGIESRKRLLQRKDAGEAYKKQAKYFQPTKNPVLEELEELLFGSKDHSVYAKQKEQQREVNPAIEDLQLVPDLTKSNTLKPIPTLLQISKEEQIDYLNNQDDLVVLDEEIDVVLPERFTKEFNLDLKANTFFGKTLEDVNRTRIFNTAIMSYSQHAEMVKNGYQLLNEPSFSRIA